MNRRGVGFGFIALGVIAFCTRYLSAASFAGNVNSWNSQLFNAMLQYVGTPLLTLSKVLVGLGIIYLVWGELTAARE